MAVIVDTLSVRPRHPEKAHRPDAPVLRKPDWIRVKAPVSRGYAETAKIVRANKRSRFLLTAPPLCLPGAVGSPATPVATV